MAIKKLDDGRYELDTRTGGRGSKRVRKIFNRKADAVAYEKYMLGKLGRYEWDNVSKVDKRPLSEILELWYFCHGQAMKNGDIEKRQLLKTINDLGDPGVYEVNKRMMIMHRSRRLSRGISASTINRDIYRLSGMFSALIKLDEFSGINPIRGLPSLPEKNPGMTFLSTEEIGALLDVLTGDYRLVALLSLSTGGRWSEVSTLTASQLMQCRVVFLETKNGKKRVVPISAELEKEVTENASASLFKVDYENFCRKLRKVKPDLPRGQATHVLRHTFASHFMMNGGNIIALQQILGHATIQQTMAYAHLAPDYLQNAVILNPLKGGTGV
ncbi:tyrosine-type recombinase/integrase [Salmonella enterica]|uniref:Site-specific integrase n=1 Tax=Salmonella enterica TaxID=28901 RepID=A0A3J2EQ82_SALER|nr:site-specific integrase [Salmonella enterica]ECU4768829.1 site-specific integrase [Salmonella enterica subsp. enterica]EDQ1017341.1 tyrosine-type recombinase/integrase [Salmonella enterica subsp. houtenae serovar 50:z4,z23:-]EDV3252738.1 tyrosine-type recombinase/integrase [Salmonella enterica subsp. houtenae]EDW0441139.1 tyrosine-type recombinase/integrase [Salmonella enterica subsp. arizonae serovar 50:z4,z23:-]HAE7875592.1 tyrosine-type recombinase/integrase [Salmonella enterica subsp. e